MTTHLRRKLALVAGLIAVATPALSACGDHAATDRYNVLANGGYDLGDGVRVAGARIVATADGQGEFVATLTLNPSVDAATSTKSYLDSIALTGVTPGAAAGNEVGSIDPASGFKRVIGDTGSLNLADGKGVKVTGDFQAGDIVPVQLTFADGTTSAVMSVPVVSNCFEYSGAGTSSYAIPSAIPSPSEAASPGAYDCAYPSLPPIGQ